MSYKRTLINVKGVLYKKLDAGALAKLLLRCVRENPAKTAAWHIDEIGTVFAASIRMCLTEMTETGILRREKMDHPEQRSGRRGRKKIFIYWEAE